MLFHRHLLGVAVLVCLSLLVFLLPLPEPETQAPDAGCAVDCQVLVEPETSITGTPTTATPTTSTAHTTNPHPACFTCSCHDAQQHQVILGPICNHDTALAERVEQFDSRLEQIEAACEKLSQQRQLILDSAHVWQEE